MADGGAAGGTREASVRDERHAVPQARTHDGGRRIQHFTHTGAALGAFVADDDDFAGVDFAAVNGVQRIFFAVKDAGLALMNHHVGTYGRAFYHAAFGGKVALQNGDAALFGDRIFHRVNDFGVENLGAFDVFGDRFAGDGHQIRLEEAQFGDFGHHGADAARFIEFFDVVVACRGEVAEIRRVAADFVRNGKIKLNAAFVRDRRKVQHGIRGTAERHVNRQRVHEGVARHDVARLHVVSDEIHDLHTGFFRKTQSGGINGGDGAVAGKGHAEDFGEAVHGIGGKHARAGTAGRAGFVFQVFKLNRRDFAGTELAYRFADVGVRDLAAFEVSGEHGAAAHDDRRNVEARRGHQKARHVFVAGGDEHQPVKGMGHRHRFRAVGDQFSGDERILHPGVSHGKAVADRNRRENDGNAACECDALLHGVHDLVKIHVARNDVVLGTHDADQGFADFGVAKAERLQKGALRGGVDALG